jgi:hypothetical protein
LFSENHDIVGFNFKRHARLRHLTINKKFAAFVLKDVLLLEEVLGESLDLSFQEAGESIQLGVTNHLN